MQPDVTAAVDRILLSRNTQEVTLAVEALPPATDPARRLILDETERRLMQDLHMHFGPTPAALDMMRHIDFVDSQPADRASRYKAVFNHRARHVRDDLEVMAHILTLLRQEKKRCLDPLLVTITDKIMRMGKQQLDSPYEHVRIIARVMDSHHKLRAMPRARQPVSA